MSGGRQAFSAVVPARCAGSRGDAGRGVRAACTVPRCASPVHVQEAVPQSPRFAAPCCRAPAFRRTLRLAQIRFSQGPCSDHFCSIQRSLMVGAVLCADGMHRQVFHGPVSSLGLRARRSRPGTFLRPWAARAMARDARDAPPGQRGGPQSPLFRLSVVSDSSILTRAAAGADPLFTGAMLGPLLQHPAVPDGRGGPVCRRHAPSGLPWTRELFGSPGEEKSARDVPPAVGRACNGT